MAVSAIQQPPSPPHSRAHYFPQASPATKNHQRSHRGLAVVHEDVHIVKSRLPTGLPDRPLDLQQDSEGLLEAKIEYHGNGRNVYVTGVAEHATDKVKLSPESTTDNTFVTTLKLPPGNHPLRFIVDDQPQLSDTLPTATDTDGTLVNYIEVPSPTRIRAHQQTVGWSQPAESAIGVDGAESGKAFPEMPWTTIIPPRLFKLAAEEEAYLTARAAIQSGSSSRSRRSPPPPLPPPPPVPYPPTLPRHLEKVILNSSSSRSAGATVSTPALLSSAASTRPRIIPENSVTARKDGSTRLGGTEGTGDDNSVLPVPNHVVLNHLGTSAIKNGVLAVGTTTRYHRKYISTIYYKPVMS